MLESMINLLSRVRSKAIRHKLRLPQCCVQRWLGCSAEGAPDGANAYPAYRLLRRVGPVSVAPPGNPVK